MKTICRCIWKGLTLDAVYENFVRQIAGNVLVEENGTTLKESIEQQKQREQLEKQIAALEAKIRKEKSSRGRNLRWCKS